MGQLADAIETKEEPADDEPMMKKMKKDRFSQHLQTAESLVVLEATVKSKEDRIVMLQMEMSVISAALDSACKSAGDRSAALIALKAAHKASEDRIAALEKEKLAQKAESLAALEAVLN